MNDLNCKCIQCDVFNETTNNHIFIMKLQIGSLNSSVDVASVSHVVPGLNTQTQHLVWSNCVCFDVFLFIFIVPLVPG